MIGCINYEQVRCIAGASIKVLHITLQTNTKLKRHSQIEKKQQQ